MADLTRTVLFWVLIASGPTIAAPRSNGLLEIDAESIDGGGGSSSNGTLMHTGSFGGIAGISSTGNTIAKQGFVAQLYEVKELQLSATPDSVDEEDNRQVSAVFLLDDDSQLYPAAGELLWSVQNGPVSIDTAGVATGLAVYQDSPALVQADRGSIIGTLGLTVFNTLLDNFGSYAGDGIDDDWQVFYFGENNPLAGPTENPDLDLSSNLQEFLTGYDPTDDEEFFSFVVLDLVGTTATIELSKIIPGTRYRIQSSTDLGMSDPWSDVANFTTGNELLQHLVTDPASTGDRHFYRIGVETE